MKVRAGAKPDGDPHWDEVQTDEARATRGVTGRRTTTLVVSLPCDGKEGECRDMSRGGIHGCRHVGIERRTGVAGLEVQFLPTWRLRGRGVRWGIILSKGAWWRIGQSVTGCWGDDRRGDAR